MPLFYSGSLDLLAQGLKGNEYDAIRGGSANTRIRLDFLVACSQPLGSEGRPP